MAKGPIKQSAPTKGSGEKQAPPAKKSNTFQDIIDHAALFTKVEFGGQDIKDLISKGTSNNELRREVGRRQEAKRVEKLLRSREEAVQNKNKTSKSKKPE